tara:strand:+ start:6121 stop:6669 length:549 start_codon:yes stop_codon:yes gene_type:complete
VKHINIPDDYIRRKTSTIDFGYELSEVKGYLKPIPFELKCLRKAENKIKKGESTRKVAEWLFLETNRYISHMGLWKHITKKTEIDFTELCDKQPDGYVYILTNPAWSDWIKVGRAVNPKDRCRQFQTSSPYRDYKMYFKRKFKLNKEAEETAHELLKKESLDFNKEWFKINKEKAKEIIKNI